MQRVARKEIHSKDVTGIDSEEFLNIDENLKLIFLNGEESEEGMRWREPRKSAMVWPGSLKASSIITW